MTGIDEENVVDDGVVAESAEEEEKLDWRTEILDVLDMKDDLENDIVLWILQMAGIRENSIGLVFVLVISAFRSVFEYGYKLQREADETL